MEDAVQTSPESDIRLVKIAEVRSWGEDMGHEGLIDLRVSE